MPDLKYVFSLDCPFPTGQSEIFQPAVLGIYVANEDYEFGTLPFNNPYKCFFASANPTGAENAADLCQEVIEGKLYEPEDGNEVTDTTGPFGVWTYVKQWLAGFEETIPGLDPPADTVPYWIGLIFDTETSQ